MRLAVHVYAKIVKTLGINGRVIVVGVIVAERRSIHHPWAKSKGVAADEAGVVPDLSITVCDEVAWRLIGRFVCAGNPKPPAEPVVLAQLMVDPDQRLVVIHEAREGVVDCVLARRRVGQVILKNVLRGRAEVRGWNLVVWIYAAREGIVQLRAQGRKVAGFLGRSRNHLLHCGRRLMIACSLKGEEEEGPVFPVIKVRQPNRSAQGDAELVTLETVALLAS